MRKWCEKAGLGLWLHIFCSFCLECPSLFFCQDSCCPVPRTWSSHHLLWEAFPDIPALYTLMHSHTQRPLFWNPHCAIPAPIIALPMVYCHCLPSRLGASRGREYLLILVWIRAQNMAHTQQQVSSFSSSSPSFLSHSSSSSPLLFLLLLHPPLLSLFPSLFLALLYPHPLFCCLGGALSPMPSLGSAQFPSAMADAAQSLPLPV